MESVLAQTSTVLVDVKGSNNMLYLPLDKMMQQQASAAVMNNSQISSDQPIQQPVTEVQPQPQQQPQAVLRNSQRGRDARGRQ
jgi:membrane protease subunit HflK